VGARALRSRIDAGLAATPKFVDRARAFARGSIEVEVLARVS
jgi:hypothetical protein